MAQDTTRPAVLYVEDNPESRLLVKRVLEAEGYRVIEAGDASAGIRKAQAEHPDLILMDINLPDMEGTEATVRLREMKEFQNVPILALTAYVMKGDRERTLAAGCSGYIRKPIDVDTLPADIAAFLKR